MQKIIWTLWLQGRENAPDVVKRCLASWESRNPDRNLRCLDARTVGTYLDMDEFVDLNHQQITAASLSDIIRILLLHEFGGVWVDASLYCNQPLDSWLPAACGTGFFAFSNPGPDRLLASWFLACAPNNRLVAKYAAMALRYWSGRMRSDDYLWFHHQFSELYAADPEARAAWEAVPKIGADGPHSIQYCGAMYEPAANSISQIDWTTPVFKLTHRIDKEAYRPGCLLHYLLHRDEVLHENTNITEVEDCSPMRFVGLRVSTENLGDHVQICAAIDF